jgi:hypothetical protein
MVRQFVSIALLVLNAIKLTSKKMSISWENILCNHLSWCKHAIKRSGASDLDLMVTVILHLTPST